jgi:hypothetical protein
MSGYLRGIIPARPEEAPILMLLDLQRDLGLTFLRLEAIEGSSASPHIRFSY